MTRKFVVDNSVVMSWCFEDETSPYSDGVLDSLTESMAVVPSIWPLEVVNVLLVAERRGRLTKADTARCVHLLQSLPITVEVETPRRIMGEILSLARDTGLSSYDASYLDLAMRDGLPIASIDGDLKDAASICNVPLFVP